MTATRTLLSGVTIPIVTPLSKAADGHLRPDADALRPMLAALTAAGITKIMLLGSNGEGPLIPTPWMTDFAVRTAEHWRAINRDNTLVINVTAAGTAEAVMRAEAVAAADPDALVCSPPIYFHHRDDEVVEHFRLLCELGRPLIIYNSPKYSTPLTEQTLRQILSMPEVIGIKDSSGDPALFELILHIAAEHGVGVSQGDEQRGLAALQLGADGVVLGVANFAPLPVVDLVQAFLDNRLDDAVAAQGIIDQLVGVHQIRPGVPTVKAILADRSLMPDDVSAPLLPCTSAEHDQLRSFLRPLESHLITTNTPYRGHRPGWHTG